MVNLKLRVGPLVSTDEGIKIDMNAQTNDHFHKVDGGLTIHTKDEDVTDLFEDEDEMVAVFMTPRQFDRFTKEEDRQESTTKLPYTRNPDGSIVIDGLTFLPAKESEQGNLMSEEEANQKAAPAHKTGDELERRDKERNEMAGTNGPDTQLE